MASVYSKSFFYDTVTPGSPVAFMTGAATETWILRDILCSVGSGAPSWSVEVTDTSGNVIFVSPTLATNPYVSQSLRMVLMPATSYTVSTSGTNVFVSISGYVLSA